MRSWSAGAIACLGLVGGCASTEFFNEGPGQPSERASVELPKGAIGVCKVPLSKRSPIVNEKLWQDAPPCTPRTPERSIRLGYGAVGAGATPDAEALLAALREGQKEDGGNTQLVAAIR